ncbi:glycosyl hydrolase 2 galactose-binding domain-containing protein [Xylophilus sp. GOD-11R]|uniref:glycoside hydrolase family 2 protein n=1 Tax=Xylophilus sp. GOD-11R TaxID=3089814 RepID=UPI00298BE8BA|nr:glycoside hydrolase family 2 protein [Xylophilus sp. GOD-11R]WPB56638.1 glycoside hydrolase family 2 protein [Xylophilus sp. GOD-11R]
MTPTALVAEWTMAVLPAGVAADPAALSELESAWTPAVVPGTAMAALFAGGQADFDRLPPLDTQDVWFRARFDVTTPSQAGTVLVFEGLATLAECWLDGESILRSDNMFLAHEVDVTGRLAAGSHTLLIRFASVQQALAARRPRPRWRTRLVEQQQLRWIRASLLGRIPGWSPAAPAIGPWKPVRLLQRGTVEWLRCDAVASLQGDAGVVAFDGVLHVTGDDTAADLAAELAVGDARAPLTLRRLDARHWAASGGVTVASAQRWWPHTHGEPALYQVDVRVWAAGTVIHRDLGRTGFRSVTLHSQSDDFALDINGVRVFCRGACWTTTDILTLIGDPAAARDTLRLARDAGMNMLRVGGTMFYEADHFYALCDEFGILLWHDWMFANMDYPADDAGFVAGVELEARQFLQRTRLSPSIGLLCGNSEIEQQAAMLGLEQPLWRNRLFGEVLPAIGAQLRPDVPYWPSSPAGGVLPFQVDAGAAHYFGVGAYLQPITDARRSGVRFTSECLAFANIPEPETLDRFLSDGQSPLHHPRWKARVPRDSSAGWDFDDVRDHYLAQLFGVDPMRLRYADMQRYLALGRLASGEAMLGALREWRRQGSSCAGAIVWFLRDLWPGAGWGVIDAYGCPKAAWFYLQRGMAPVGLFMTDEGVNGLALHAVNDSPRPIAAQVELTLYRHGEKPVAHGSATLQVPAHGSAQIRGDALFGHFTDSTWTYRFGPAGHDVAHAVLSDTATGQVLGSDFYFPLGHGFAVQPGLGLTATLVPDGPDRWRMTVRCPRFAQAVAIDAPGFRISHNYFHLAPGGEQTVVLLARQPGARLRASLQAANGVERCVPTMAATETIP